MQTDIRKISVLMSLYKGENPNSFKECMESILNQTYKADEIIIVKDGPLGKELLDCLTYYDKNYQYVKVINSEKNLGLGKALNLGLKFCNNDLVARMDTDDISVLDRFEIQISKLIENQDIDVIGSNIIEFEGNKENTVGRRVLPELNSEIHKYAISRNPMNHMTIIFNKAKVIEAGGYQDCNYFEDYYLWTRMLKKGSIFYNVQKDLVYVRAGKDMTKRRGGISYIKDIINFQNKLFELEIINSRQYYKNIFVRSVVSILGNSIRYKIYNLFLRKKVKVR